MCEIEHPRGAKSSMDAFCLCFEGQKPLVGFGVEPQRHRPLQKPSLSRLAIFLDHLLDPRALVRRMGRVDGPHSSSVLRTDTAHCLRLHSLAKFVTDQAMTDCLRRSGIDYAQGCHIGVPRSIVETFAPRLSATT